MNETPFSSIIAGVMSWGVWGRNCTTPKVIELMHACLDGGITSFDHADIYGDYTTEEAFGVALRESKIDRQSIQLISKCGIQMTTGRDNAVKHYDYDADYIVWSVERSLQKLQTDYLDLLLLHRPSPLMRADAVAEAIDRLRGAGKILNFGLSNFTPSQTDLIQTKTNVQYNQIEFSITHFDPMLDGSLDHMRVQDIIPMAYSPMGMVFRQDNDQTQRIKKTAGALAEKYNVPIEIILLAWILKHPAGLMPVAGTANPERIGTLMKATEIVLETQEWFALWEASSGNPVA